LFLQTDNLFLRPSWWEALSLARRDALKRMVLSGTTMQPRSTREFVDDGTSLLSAAVIETARD
jgi:hypothetical protein